MSSLKLYCLLVLVAINPVATAVGSSWHMANVNSNGNVGDAHILVNGDVVTMIDAGDYEQAKISLLSYLSRIGIKQVDHFFVSHPHNDHYAGIDALLEGGVKLNNIYYNMPPKEVSDFAYTPGEFLGTLRNAEIQGAKLHDVSKGFRITLPGGSQIKVLYAHKDRQFDGVNVSVNDYSLITQWDTEGFRVLFTGDLNYLLGNYLSKYDYFKADILKVPHHGVTGIAPNDFFDIVDPKLNMFPTPLALWSHPRVEQAKNWTLNKKIFYCVTGLNGNIALNFKQSTISLKPEISSHNCPTGGTIITPGEKINESRVLPQILLLLK